MLIKFILILYCITPDFYNSLSIRKDIDMAKQFLKYYGIPEPDLCTDERISELCSNNQKEVCSARLSKKKMEFKQFQNPCYMDLDNLCKSQDNIWTIKNSGPCVMNAELRRFAKEIEEHADAKSTETDANPTEATRTDDANTTDDGDETTPDDYETTTDRTVTDDEEVTETSPDDTTDQGEGINGTTPDDTTENTNSTEDVTEETNVTDETTTDEMNVADVTEVLRTAEGEDTDTTNDETIVAEDAVTESETAIVEDENATEDTTLGGITTDSIKTNALESTNAVEIGKIMYDDGSVKTALREGRFPPMLGEKSWDKVPCTKRVKPCPNINFPVCLFYKKEIPNNITYYYFINKCEAQQYTCYHPERKIDGASSLRAGFCAHIQYINYARFFHTMSAWGHYGWLHGPWAYNHILKPHERA